MSYYHARPIHLELRPSVGLTCLLGLFVSMNLLVLLLLPMAAAIKIALIGVVMATGVRAVRQHALLLSTTAVISVRVDHESRLRLTLKDGRQYDARVLASSFVASYLTVLQLKVAEQRWPVALIILPDSVIPEQFRELRVWLKWGEVEVA